MFETKKGAIRKMLREADKIADRKKFKMKVDILLMAETLAMANNDDKLVAFVQELMVENTKQEHEYVFKGVKL